MLAIAILVSIAIAFSPTILHEVPSQPIFLALHNRQFLCGYVLVVSSSTQRKYSTYIRQSFFNCVFQQLRLLKNACSPFDQMLDCCSLYQSLLARLDGQCPKKVEIVDGAEHVLMFSIQLVFDVHTLQRGSYLLLAADNWRDPSYRVMSIKPMQ